MSRDPPRGYAFERSDRPITLEREEFGVARYAIVVMSKHSDGNPSGQGRMVHALSAAKAFKDAGEDASLWFHGIGVGWLEAFDARYDAFTRNYGPLFDELRRAMGGACNFCTTKRFGVTQAAERLGVPVVGGEGERHTVADLVRRATPCSLSDRARNF